MRCPACNGVMVIIEHEKIEVDYCTDCFGVWFDAGELELLLGSLSMNKDDLQAHVVSLSTGTSTNEKKRKCPICGKKMNKLFLGEKPEVTIDTCGTGHGLWFDGGELDQVLKQHKENHHDKEISNKVVHFLGEIFKTKE